MALRLWLLLGAVLATSSGDDQLIEKITIEVAPGRNATDDWSWQLHQEQAAGIPPLEELKVDAARYDSVQDGISYETLDLQITARRLKNCSPPSDYTYFPGIGSYKRHVIQMTWDQAKAACESEGAYLVVINSEEEAAALKELKNPNNPLGYALIGIYDPSKNGSYVTIFGETLKEAGYTKWQGGEPNNVGQENCGSINILSEINDIYCEDKLDFICEAKQCS